MDDIARMHIMHGFEELVHNVTFVDVFQNIAPFDYIVKICV